MLKIRDIVQSFPYVGLDTRFPGILEYSYQMLSQILIKYSVAREAQNPDGAKTSFFGKAMFHHSGSGEGQKQVKLNQSEGLVTWVPFPNGLLLEPFFILFVVLVKSMAHFKK